MPSNAGACSRWLAATPAKAISRPTSAALSSNSTVNVVGSLLRRNGLEIAELALVATERAQCHHPRDAFEHERRRQHHVIDPGPGDRLGMPQVHDAFVDRHAGAHRQHQQRDHERPEVEFAPIAERMAFVWCLGRARAAVQQQQFVDRIHQRVHALADHGRAAGDRGGDELGDRDGHVAAERDQHHKLRRGRFRRHGRHLEDAPSVADGAGGQCAGFHPPARLRI